MTEACWEVFYHSCSSDGNPQHDYCPKTVDSWCRYNKALHRCEFDDFPPPHNPTIPADLAKCVKQIFEDLCSEKLLEVSGRSYTEPERKLQQYHLESCTED